MSKLEFKSVEITDDNKAKRYQAILYVDDELTQVNYRTAKDHITKQQFIDMIKTRLHE